MRKTILFVAVTLLAVGCKGGDTTAASGTTTGSAASSGATDGKAYTFKFAPKLGDKFSYLVSMDSPDDKTEIGLTMSIDKVEGDKVTMAATVDSMRRNGQEAPADVMAMIKKVRNISEMDSSARTLSTKTEGAPPGTPDQKSTNGVTFPSGPIKVGDTWEGSSTTNGKDMKVHCKLASVSAVGGKEIATIEATPETQESMTLDGPLIIKIDLGNGMTYGMTMKGTAKSPDGKTMPVSMEMKQK